MDLYFTNPQQFWFARHGDFPEADLTDDHRYSDSPPLDWHWMCDVINQVVERWDTAAVDPDDGDLHFTIPDPPSDREHRAIRDWGRGVGSCPRTDPGDTLQDGRHRTAGCWQHQPDMLLPIRSDILSAIDDVASDETWSADARMARTLRDSCHDKLVDLQIVLDPDDWLDEDSSADIDTRHAVNRGWLRRILAVATATATTSAEGQA